MLFIGIDRHSHKSTRVDIKNFFRCSNYVDENDGKNKTKKKRWQRIRYRMYRNYVFHILYVLVSFIRPKCELQLFRFCFVWCTIYIYTDFKLMFNLISNSGKITWNIFVSGVSVLAISDPAPALSIQSTRLTDWLTVSQSVRRNTNQNQITKHRHRYEQQQQQQQQQYHYEHQNMEGIIYDCPFLGCLWWCLDHDDVFSVYLLTSHHHHHRSAREKRMMMMM